MARKAGVEVLREFDSIESFDSNRDVLLEALLPGVSANYNAPGLHCMNHPHVFTAALGELVRMRCMLHLS